MMMMLPDYQAVPNDYVDLNGTHQDNLSGTLLMVLSSHASHPAASASDAHAATATVEATVMSRLAGTTVRSIPG
jgi:hypothetical protein